LQALLAKRTSFKQAEFAKALTCIERLGSHSLQFKELLSPKKPAYRIGITGPPGAGKSTLIAALIKALRAKGKRVGVLAVDPSSPFTNGALLGDRIRFSESFTDPGVFIRSIGSRGSQGGLSALSYLLLRGFDAYEFDVVLLETVGVGQTELEVMYVADTVIVTLVPEGGDAVQAMKAGLLEIADVFVVNKSDRPGAESFAKELKDSLELTDDEACVLLTSAAQNKKMKARNDIKRLQAEARALTMLNQLRKIEAKILKVKTTKDLASFSK
jgi:LAO/AO transport system kinase